MKIVFAGTPEFSVDPLIKIAEKYSVAAVLTQPDRAVGRGKKITYSAVKNQAITLNIPVYQPINMAELESIVISLQADIVIVVAYGMIFSQEILDLPKYGCINIHASILPEWRGAAPIQRAIQNGDDKTGVSIMKMEKGLDSGPVYNTLTTQIQKTDTSQNLHDRLSKMGSEGILELLSRINSGEEITFHPQSNNGVSYAKKITKQEATIDWSMHASALDQQIRAFNPWPVCQSCYQNVRIRIWQAELVYNEHNADPGQILTITDDGILIACGSQALLLTILQKDGSKKMHHKEFRNGFNLTIGEFFK